MKLLTITLAVACALAFSGSARAQEPELINEIVARVNSDIITRADYLNAARDFREELASHMAGKSAAEIDSYRSGFPAAGSPRTSSMSKPTSIRRWPGWPRRTDCRT